jgi:ribosomal protein S1
VEDGETGAEVIRRRLGEYLSDHPVNSVVEVEVEQITDREVFVKLQEGLEGRVPVSELSWRFTEHASDEVHPGMTLRLLITKATEDPPRVTLSARALVPHPYDDLKRGHGVRDRVAAEVERVSRSHVNVRFSNGAVGVVHVSNLRWERVEDATTLYRSGEAVTAEIVRFDDEKRQVELSVKALLPKPYSVFKDTHRIDSVTDARVTGMNKSFAYVALPGGAEGSIHVSKLTAHRVADPSEVVRKGQTVKVTVIGWDDDRSKVQLAMVAESSGHATVGAKPVPITSSPSAQAIPAQWAPDPHGRFELRYWDGTRWTVHVAQAGVQRTDPLGP